MIKFTIMVRPFSVNAYHYRDKRHKTVEARAWEASVIRNLEPYEKSLLELAEDYKKQGGYFTVTITAYYPPHIYYNLQEEISSKTVDITNFEKPTIDVVFGQVMQVNDKAIVRCTSQKLPGPFYALEIALKLYAYADPEGPVAGDASTDEDGTY